MLTVLMLISSAPLAGFVGFEWPEFKAEAASVSGGYLTSGYCGDPAEGDTKNIYWELDDEGVLTITGTGKIAPEAFNYDLRIKEVVISDGITNISDYCFNQCSNLVKVTMGDDIVTIDSYAFDSCINIISVEFPDRLENIGEWAFRSCGSLKNVIFPPNLRKIGWYAFGDCDSLVNIFIPNSVSSVGGNAFAFCENLKAINVGSGVTNLSNEAFVGSSSLEEINVSKENMVYSSVEGVLYNKDLTKLLIVPDGISGEVVIHGNTEEITYSAFRGCKKLSAIYVSSENLQYMSIDGIVYSADRKVLVVCPQNKTGSVIVDAKTEIISSYAFHNCKSLAQISLPDGLKYINEWAFRNCENLIYIDLPEGLLSIGAYALADCYSITNIILPESLEFIGEQAFAYNKKLEYTYIGANVDNLPNSAFYACDSLCSFTVSQNNKSYSSVDGVLYDKEKSVLYIVPNSINVDITIPETVSSFSYTAVSGCKKLSAINIDENNKYYKSVDGLVYSKDGKRLIVCPRGKKGSVYVAGGTEIIGRNAFYNCISITNVILPYELKIIEDSAFKSCSKLEKINLPEGLLRIEIYAFDQCVELSEIIIPKNIAKISNYMLRNCGLTELTLPETVQSFDHAYWSKLKTFTILNRYCEYTSTDAPTFAKDCTIRAYCGSLGHTFAVKRMVNFESIGHTYLDWYVYQPATFEQEGIERRDCAYCDGYDERITPKLESDVFTATFVADGEVVATVDFPKGTTSIAEPKVPAKDRYMGEWEEYTLADADITINAIYTLIKSEDASEIETESDAIHYTDKDDVLFKFKAWADALVVKSTVSKSVPLDIVLVVDQSGSMDETLGGRTKKVDALKETAKDFVNTVLENAKITGADHRISLVGFGLSGHYSGFEKNENTELLTSDRGIVKFDNIKTTDYASSLISVNVDGEVNSKLITAINSIAARGATAADLGFEMAKGVFANTDSTDRQRVVIFMTDGEPTYSSSFQTSVANAAIYNASLLKSVYDASIYSVGVFSAADSNNRNINKFMNAVSSGYPDAISMNYMGKGVDGQYYLTVNNTDSLTSVFKTISTESLSHTAPFDNLTFIKTLSEYVTITSKQEDQLRIDLIRQYGITNDDIIITKNDDGTTTVQINGLTPYETTDKNGNVIYEVGVEFFAALNEKAATAGDYVVDTEDSGVMLGEDAKGYEATFDTNTITLTSKKTRVIFTVNGEVYEISESISNGYAVSPEIEIGENWVFSGWDTTSKKATNGLVLDAVLTKADRTITWHTAEGDIVQYYAAGAIITAPTVGMTAQGDIFLSWDKSIPTTMPDENLEYTAIYGKHVHNYTSAVTKKMTCETDGVRTYTCLCGDTYDEVITAIGHNYEAMTPSLDKEDAKCTFCCTNCGDKYDYALNYEVVETTGKKTRVLYEFSLTDDELNTDMQPDGTIQIRIPLSEIHGSAEHVTVIRTNDDGTKTQVPVVHEKGFLIISCDHFTPYEVIFDIPCDGHIQGEWIVTKTATCTEEGFRYALCTECEKTVAEETITKLPHIASDWTTEVDSTCSKEGKKFKNCTVCQNRMEEGSIEKKAHNYNGDNKCDDCDENCKHMCHKGGFSNFIWKIVRFFLKLFKINPVCDCGVKHY